MRKCIDETLVNMFTNSEYNNSYIFYACIIGKCKIKYDNTLTIPTNIKFVVNHYELTINIDLFSKFPLVQRMGTFKHESLHIINKHISRFKDIEHSISVDMACDCAINQLIESEHLPHNSIDLAFLNLVTGEELEVLQSAEYYYNKLNASNFEDEYEIELPDVDHAEWEESKGETDVIEMSTDKMINDSINETVKMSGKLPLGIQKNISIKKGHTVKWKTILRNIIHSTRSGKLPSIKRPNRRFPNRMDIKGTKRNRKFNLLVVWDVSGSVTNRDSKQVLNEIKSIHESSTSLSKMMLIQVDVEAYKPEEFTSKTKSIERKGNGGTDLYPAIVRAKRENINYDCVIVLTDGYLSECDINAFANNPNTSPVIWIIVKGGNKSNLLLSKHYCKRFSVVRL